jgi:hypothetical protein
MPKIVHNVLCGFSDFNRSKSACDTAVALGACEFGSALLGALSVLGIGGFDSPTVFVALGAALLFTAALFRNLVSSLFAKKLEVLEKVLMSSMA